MDTGTLEVVVYRGRDLSGNKPDQLPSTSVEIKLGKEVVGTKLVQNNRSPQWNTVHNFEKIDMKSEKLVLELTLRDKKDKFGGRVQIFPAQVLAKDRRFEKWYPLLNKKLEEDSSITGDIQVKLRFISSIELKEKEEAKAHASERAMEEAAKDRNTLLEGRKPVAKPSPFGDQYGSNRPIDNVVDQEIQAILQETERVRTESKGSTTRTLQKINEAQQIGVATSEKLAHQGEQLNRIADDSYKIEDDMKIAARQIRGIKSIFGAAANLFTRSPGSSRRKNKDSKDKKASKDDSPAPERKLDGQQQFQREGAPGPTKYDDDDIDRDLDQISLGLDNLKNIAEGMGREVDSQTKTIDRLLDQTDKNDGLIKKYNWKIGAK